MIKRWNLNRADQAFSRHIRARDGRCMNPLCPYGLQHQAEIWQLECSHYWPRAIKITRFDPDNCLALCGSCHRAWENSKEGKYKELMIRLLGLRKFNSIAKKVYDYKHKGIPFISEGEMIKACRKYLTKLKSHAEAT